MPTEAPPDLDQAIAALQRLTVTQLRERYLESFGEPTRSCNRDFLFKRLAWRLQSLAEGGLSERARRRAQELARDADLRMTLPRPPTQHGAALGTAPGAVPAARTVTLPVPRVTAHDRLPIPGTVLTRTYRGQRVDVTVLPDGFEHEGQVYRSLSAVAKAVTGSHWNGHLFFGLTTHKRDRTPKEELSKEKA
jgi:hypothetical protein